ncbi:MAG TPA: fumarylacetoacetate hydrolase family protein [Galbitalea sp.]|jgi:2-oxopent-4-enoate hydratase|nr:fumarylacetoacetate hydrolase family protein [Galbitalea sp.]
MTKTKTPALERLLEARATGRPCSPVRDLLVPPTVDAAYAVQLAWIESRLDHGASVVGRKIGLTNPAVQRQLGVDSPDYGFLLTDMFYLDGASIEDRVLLQPRVEAEVAFVLRSELDLANPTEEDVLAATEYVCAALEIVDSRIADWDIQLVDTIADNASAGAFVLGSERHEIDDDLANVAMSMQRNQENVSEGMGSDCMGSPLRAVAWLARTCAALGSPLRAGEIVLSGALGRVVDARPGDTFTAGFTGLGSVSVAFAESA